MQREWVGTSLQFDIGITSTLQRQHSWNGRGKVVQQEVNRQLDALLNLAINPESDSAYTIRSTLPFGMTPFFSLSLLWTTKVATAAGALVLISSSTQYCSVVLVSSTSSTMRTRLPRTNLPTPEVSSNHCFFETTVPAVFVLSSYLSRGVHGARACVRGVCARVPWQRVRVRVLYVRPHVPACATCTKCACVDVVLVCLQSLASG